MFENKKILIVAAHPDDFDLACGGTIWKYRHNKIEVVCFSDATNVSGNHNIKDEFWKAIHHYGIGLRTCLYEDIQNMQFYRYEDTIKARLWYILKHFKPDIILTTSPKSLNMDHALLGRCVMNVFQEQTVLFYEDIRGGQYHTPQLFIKLTPDEFQQKLVVLSYYHTQKQQRPYFEPDRVGSMALFRGAIINANHVESFEVGRIVI